MILRTYLVKCIMQRVDFFLCLLFAETVLKKKNMSLSPQPVLHILVCFFTCLATPLTYTFKHLPPDDDERVGQRTQAGLVPRLRRYVVARHPLYVEM